MADTFAALVVFACFLALLYGGWKRDTTDAPGGSRLRNGSGLIVFRDHATGVQYVGAPFVGMAVRVDRDGKPFIEEQP